MQITAEKCHRSIRWSSYNIDQKMIAVEQEKYKTIRKLTVFAVIAADRHCILHALTSIFMKSCRNYKDNFIG